MVCHKADPIQSTNQRKEKQMLNKIRNRKGFTLIELLIVVAIIGILAAIAIPQFSAYRIRGYNSAATADLRNSRTAMEAFFSDWQVYPSTNLLGVAGPGLPYNNATAAPLIQVAKNGISATAPSSAATVQFPVSANVTLLIDTDAAGSGSTYVMATKNASGDRCYAADADATQIFWMNGAIGGILAAGVLPVATGNVNNLAPGTPPVPAASIAPCAGGTQTTWVPIS
jgi:prepilin-type N-terminal cleavage/methylation domain-containing protein